MITLIANHERAVVRWPQCVRTMVQHSTALQCYKLQQVIHTSSSHRGQHSQWRHLWHLILTVSKKTVIVDWIDNRYACTLCIYLLLLSFVKNINVKWKLVATLSTIRSSVSAEPKFRCTECTQYLSTIVGHCYKTETENESKLSGINKKSIGPFSIVKDIFNKARCKLYS